MGISGVQNGSLILDQVLKVFHSIKLKTIYFEIII